MNIFEDKKHNDMRFIGQKPVRSVMVPEESRDAKAGLINHQVEQPMSVKNLPNKD